VVGVHGQTDLLEVVLTLQARGRLADLLDGRHEQANQDGDDRNDHQQLDQRKSSTEPPATRCETAQHACALRKTGNEEKKNSSRQRCGRRRARSK
jgi:hypothetical protein